MIFRIRHLINEVPSNGNIILNVPEDIRLDFIKTLVEVIYEQYVEKKLEGLPTSLTTVVRRKDFYDIGSESYKTVIKMKGLQESKFIYNHRNLI